MNRTVACIVVASALGVLPALLWVGFVLGWVGTNLVEAVLSP